MMPSAFIRHDRLPVTANGKLDRCALSEPVPKADYQEDILSHPREEIVCQIIGDYLGIKIRPSDNFLALGGDSLMAARVVNRIRDALGMEISIKDLLDSSQVGAICRYNGRLVKCRPTLARTLGRVRFPLSPAQRQLWVVEKFGAPQNLYNIALAMHMKGTLRPTALRMAIGDLIGRHEPLRTCFDEDGLEIEQVVRPPEAEIPWAGVEVVGRHELSPYLTARARRGFDLTAEIPIRAHLAQVGENRYVLLLVIHHAACDLWSFEPLCRDLATAYNARVGGGCPAWDALPVQYGDYCLWQQDLLAPGEDLNADISFWKENLSGAPRQISLPFDYPRPKNPSYAVGVETVRLAAHTHASILRLARNAGTTHFMVLQAALAIILSQEGAGEDMVIGTVSSGRIHEAVKDLVGHFVNPLALRTNLSGDPTFRDLLGRVKLANMAAYDHQHVPFYKVVEALNPPRSLTVHPVFQAGVALRPRHSCDEQFAALSMQLEEVNTRAAHFDFGLEAVECRDNAGGGAELRCEFNFALDLFDRTTVSRMVRRFSALVPELIAHPDLPVSHVSDFRCHGD
jgi:acyl carrier protein